MKKFNKKILGLSIITSSLTVMTPVILTSCSTNEIKEFPNPNKIIDFNKYQNYVYVSTKDDPNWDPFAPTYKNQEIYQFQYILQSAFTSEQFINIQKSLSLKEEKIGNSNIEYFVKRDFRNVDLLTKTFSNLTYELVSSKNSNLHKPPTNDSKFRLNGNSNEIFFNEIKNENLESIIVTTKETKNGKDSRSFTWYVYPKKNKFWNVEIKSTKNAYFSINIY